MATYTVKPNQNLFDIAIHLYGSVEGLFDLLISNPGINMTTDLRYGQELEYHSEFVVNRTIVEEMGKRDIVPSSGARHVYFKRPAEDLLVIIGINVDTQYCSFVASGTGEMLIDWGDNTPIEIVPLTFADVKIEHYFDNETEQRRIRIYGDTETLAFTHLDTTGIGGALVVCKPIVVDKYSCVGMGYSLTGLAMFEDTFSVNLRNSIISSLDPLRDMSLQELDLRDAIYTEGNIVDDYLVYLVEHHEDRRPCTIHLTATPGPRGYEAMDTLLGEPEWNISDTWKFYINNELYIPAEDGTNP